VHPRCPTKYSELEGVDSQIYRTFLWSESDILGEICPTWEYERWYTWSVLYINSIYALSKAMIGEVLIFYWNINVSWSWIERGNLKHNYNQCQTQASEIYMLFFEGQAKNI